jgi:hypothetical protein
MELIFTELPIFTEVINKLLSHEEYRVIQLELLKNPRKGDVIKGTGGARKIRAGLQNKGKRGGIRVVYYFQDANDKVWFLAAYAKKDQADISPDDKKGLAYLIKTIKETQK